MKVISGKYKGRNLLGHDLIGTRPTMDRVKESLFAMLQFEIEDKIVLDLFSGSGNLGIESLSMNAKFAYLVDYNQKAIKIINENLKNLNINKDQYKVLNLDYKKALLFFKDNHLKLDMIFLDPPYKTNYIEESINLITDYDLLAKDGLIVCESDSLDKIIYQNSYTVIKNKKYGDKYIVILKK